MKDRLDITLVTKGLAKSRTAAGVLIKQGSVVVNGKVITKPSTIIDTGSLIELTETLPFVSRAGQKLAYALEKFNIKVKDLIALDIGASTGGFTDCLLQNSIQKVYAVDVGTMQLDSSLRNNPKVVVMEQTDIRNASLPELVDIVVIDVSFISLSHIFPILHSFIKKSATIIALIKPQFEVGKENIDKKGIVKNIEIREKSIAQVKQYAIENGFKVHEVIQSPITGSTGNTEYLMHLSL